MSDDEKESGFISHLAELRKRLIHSFVFLIVFFIELSGYGILASLSRLLNAL